MLVETNTIFPWQVFQNSGYFGGSLLEGRCLFSAGCRADLHPGTCSESFQQQFWGDLGAAEQHKLKDSIKGRGREGQKLRKAQFPGDRVKFIQSDLSPSSVALNTPAWSRVRSGSRLGIGVTRDFGRDGERHSTVHNPRQYKPNPKISLQRVSGWLGAGSG